MVVRHLHFIWGGPPMPDHLRENLTAWRDMHPRWDVTVWGDEDLGWLQHRDLFDAAPSLVPADAVWQLRSDIARYEILLKHGGLYVDCFGGETKAWTRDGVFTLKELAGREVELLVRPNFGAGVWRTGFVSPRGVQPLLTVTLRRGVARKTIRATPNHRWFVMARNDPRRHEHIEKLTEELRPGDRLKALLPVRGSNSDVSPFGVAAGVVFGDGSTGNDRGTADVSSVQLYGPKTELRRFFEGSPQKERPAHNGKPAYVQVYSLPRFMNQLPPLDEARSYLLGWLAGYFATDGNVSKNGHLSISCIDREPLEHLRAVAARCGVGTWDIVENHTSGFSSEEILSYRIGLMRETLPDGFFVRSDQAAALNPDPRHTSPRWTVESVEDNGDIEEVYCATVPGDRNFTLDGWINVGNCDTHPLRPVDDALEGHSIWAAMEDRLHVGNTYLYSRPHHPLMQAIVDGLSDSIRRNRGKRPNWMTGPRFLTPLWRRYGAYAAPQRDWFPISYSDARQGREPDIPDSAYAVHSWHHLRTLQKAGKR